MSTDQALIAKDVVLLYYINLPTSKFKKKKSILKYK